MTSNSAGAPIALFVYSRADLTRLTLEALAANRGAGQSDLVIFSDGPKGESDRLQVAEVRALIADTRGFRSVKLVEAKANLGLARSIISGVTAMAAEHGRVIVMEDDIVTSPVFLDYMNDALELYRESESVGAISGYLFPLEEKLPDTFFLADESCWGWATWQRAWRLFEPDGKKLLSELERRRQTRTFDVNASFPFTQMLKDQIAGTNDSWAIRWRASMFLNGLLSLYPSQSLVHNVGNDQRGTHARPSDRFFATDLRHAPVTVTPMTAQVHQPAERALEAFYRAQIHYGLKDQIKAKLRRMKHRLMDAS
jgi:hypothetical protein